MKLVFFGDSITDMARNRGEIEKPYQLGEGYVFLVQSKLSSINPLEYDCINKGISGERSIDLIKRVKEDIIDLKPDVLTILGGANDLWHTILFNNGVDLKTFKKTFRLMLDEIKEALPNVKLIIFGQALLKGISTTPHYDKILEIRDFAKATKKIAKDYNAYFIDTQKVFDKKALEYGEESILYDGIHPQVYGSTLMADEWMKVFKKINK